MTHPTDQEILHALQPWFTSFSTVFQMGEDAQLRAVGLLGIPRATERAGAFHWASRTFFRSWCDETNGLFRFGEEKDGMGLDFIVCNLIHGKPFIIRFGRLNNLGVKRNSTHRQETARAHGVLSSEFLFAGLDEPEPGELRQVTLVYTLEDDQTLGGIPAWYVSRLSLVKEQFDGADHLADVDRFLPPASISEDVRRVVATPHPEQLALWRKQIGDARKHG